MFSIAIVRRGPHLVVSCAISTPRGEWGWHCASNWRTLQPRAAQEVAALGLTVGPFW